MIDKLSVENRNIINKALFHAKKMRECEVALIKCLQEIDQSRIYSLMGIRSLYHFCLEKLGLSESSSYNFMKSARIAKVYPEIEKKIIDGKMTLGNVSKVANFFDNNPTIKGSDRRKIIESIEGKTGKECQTTLLLTARGEDALDEKMFKEVLRAVGLDYKRLSVTLHDDTILKLQRVKNLSAHRGIFNYQKTIDFMSTLTLKAIDPSLRKSKNRSTAISKKREVWKRAGGVCEQCGSDFCLEIDHVIPKGKGGSSELHNLRLLCKNCNQSEAIKVFGKDHMSKFLN